MGPELIIKVITFFLPFLFSLCFHEFAHAWAAQKFGDNTANIMGRMSLNPAVHVDWVGTVMLPIMGIVGGLPVFGWAKPVPVNPRNLSRPKQQMFWIALAGPLSNIFLFFVGLIVFAVVHKQTMFPVTATTSNMLRVFLIINLLLAFFNLLPLHPLDGGKVLARFLPPRWDMWLEEKQYIMYILLLLLVIFGGIRYLSLPVMWIYTHSTGLVLSL